jgi:flagellar biosynthesis protein FliR
MARVLTQSHLLALRICSPFLIFGLVVNVAIGLLARLTPQVQIYFISGPLLIFLGIYALMLLSQDFFTAFTAEFADWTRRG